LGDNSAVNDARWGGKEERSKRELALLRNVMAAVNSSLELDQVLNLVLHTILETLGAGFAGMVLLTDQRGLGFEIVAREGLPFDDVPRRIFPDRHPCNKAAESGMPMLEAECPGCACRAAHQDERPHGHLVFPLKARQTVVGVLCLLFPPGFEVATTDLSLWEDIGTQIGRVIEDARLNTRIQQEQELLHTLYAVSDHLAASLDLDWVLSQVLRLAISAADAHNGSIFLLPAAGGVASHILRRDLPPSEASQIIDRVVDQGLAGWVVRHRTGAIVSDASQDPRWLSFSDEPDPPGSVLAVPLMADDRVLGVLTLDHPETDHFYNRHLRLMLAIAHQASVAIDKARLHKEVTHLAETLAQRVEERTRELKETQVQLIQAEKLAALGELAAGIAHEINNPLHILQAYTEYLVSRTAPEDPLLEFLEPMQDSLESIAHLAGQLRDFSRPASGEWKPVNVNEAMTTVLRLVQKELMRCQVEVTESLSPDLPKVMGDSRQLEQAFLNLILNARDAMPGGGRLTIETCADRDTACIRFNDTGIGINDKDLPRIFEPYFTTKKDRGTGLGLAICHRIVTQHGGKIAVASKVGRGTEFTVHLVAASLE
jgi:signal transduction histidine kinase